MTLPDPQVHFDHAAHNERLLDILEQEFLPRHPEFLDWAIVVTFYAALHYTKGALLRDHGVYAVHHVGHSDPTTGRFVPGHTELVRQHFDRNVRAAYNELFHRSTEARYRPFYKKAATSVPAHAQLALFRVQLETIKAACL